MTPRGIVTVMKRQCAWCGRTFAWGGGPGRPPSYCRRSHRQRAYEARREAERLGIGGVLVAEDAWRGLLDALYRLETQVDDAVMDVAAGDPPDEALRSVAAVVAEVSGALPEPLARSVTSQ